MNTQYFVTKSEFSGIWYVCDAKTGDTIGIDRETRKGAEKAAQRLGKLISDPSIEN